MNDELVKEIALNFWESVVSPAFFRIVSGRETPVRYLLRMAIANIAKDALADNVESRDRVVSLPGRPTHRRVENFAIWREGQDALSILYAREIECRHGITGDTVAFCLRRMHGPITTEFVSRRITGTDLLAAEIHSYTPDLEIYRFPLQINMESYDAYRAATYKQHRLL